MQKNTLKCASQVSCSLFLFAVAVKCCPVLAASILNLCILTCPVFRIGSLVENDALIAFLGNVQRDLNGQTFCGTSMIRLHVCNNPCSCSFLYFFSLRVLFQFKHKALWKQIQWYFWALFLNLVGESIKLLLYWSWDKYLSTALYGFITPPPPPSCVLVIVGSHTDWNVCMYHNI